MIKKVRTITVGVGAYRIPFNKELRRSFLFIESGPLKGKWFLIEGSIPHNHHPVVITFYTVRFLLFWRKPWIQAAIEGEETCELIEKTPEELRTDREITQHMLNSHMDVMGYPRVPVTQ
jgi:hypothetical protein